MTKIEAKKTLEKMRQAGNHTAKKESDKGILQMKIKWQGDSWMVKYYPDGYARWVLENGNASVSWLQTDEQNFNSQKQFVKFLRQREKENVIH